MIPKLIRTPPEPRRSLAQTRRGEAGQASLVALLAGVVIIGLLAWLFLFRPSGRETPGTKGTEHAIVPSNKKTLPGRAMDQGVAVECRNNLSQLRSAVQIDTDPVEGTVSPSLQSLRGIPASMQVCPLSKRPYLYNPQTGQVACPTPVHRGL